MKTILHILFLLLVTAIVAGGVYTLVENTTLVSSDDDAGRGQPPAMTNADGTSTQPVGHAEGGGGEHGASFIRGLSGILVTLGKLGGIAVLVLLFQSLVARLQKRQIASPAFK
jgi:hypothetical protein